MISFKPIFSEERESLFENELSSLEGEESALVSEILNSFIEEDGVEYAVTLEDGCLLVRIFDMGRYLFLFPFEITREADIEAALLKIFEYARREELPIVFSDVGIEDMAYFKGCRHLDLDAEDSYGERYRVRIKTECELLSDIPEYVGERVTISAIEEGDIPLYAELCRDEETNKYWGYKYSEDVKNPKDEWFFENAIREFNTGTALSMAVRVNREFVGEIILYAFDPYGRAECAIRLLKARRGVGIATEAMRLLIKLSRDIGLLELSAYVALRNKDSKKLFESFADEERIEGERIKYIIKL